MISMSETENTDCIELEFVYRKELWFANLFINSTKIDIHEIVKDLETNLKSKLKKLRNDDLPNCKWSIEVQNSVIEIAKNIDFTISWNSVVQDFPYVENKTHYNQAGYLEFDVEYYKGDVEKKKQLKPWILHEVPIYIINQIKKYAAKIDHIIVDPDPMYIVAIADRTFERGLRVEVPWTDLELDKHKKCISQWISLYSGRWEDYRERLLADTVGTNLSFRKSELHYIRDESAFFYIAESDFNHHYESYYKSKIIRIIGEMRAFQNAIYAINRSLDILKKDVNTIATFKLEDAIKTLSELEYLVGGVEGKVSEIKNELESNRYRYYKKVLNYAYELMDIDRLTNQLVDKTKQISDSLQNRVQKIQQETQLKVEQSTRNLTWFFGLGLFASIVDLVVTFVGSYFNPDITIVEKGITLAVSGVFTLLFFIFGFVLLAKAKPLQKLHQDDKIKYTVDAVITDKKDRILLAKRRFAPFEGEYALPGGFKELAEDAQETLVREVREETAIDLQYGEWEEIGLFDKPGRDPRGPVHTRAYLCQIPDIEEGTKNFRNPERLNVINLSDLKDYKLAFDHEDIIRKALKKREVK